METQTLHTGFEFLLLLYLAMIGLWGVALWDILRSEFRDSITKLIWVLVAIFVPFLGVLLYFIIGRNQRMLNPEDV